MCNGLNWSLNISRIIKDDNLLWSINRPIQVWDKLQFVIEIDHGSRRRVFCAILFILGDWYLSSPKRWIGSRRIPFKTRRVEIQRSRWTIRQGFCSFEPRQFQKCGGQVWLQILFLNYCFSRFGSFSVNPIVVVFFTLVKKALNLSEHFTFCLSDLHLIVPGTMKSCHKKSKKNVVQS